MSTDQRATSTRFFLQMIFNIFICNQAQKIISKRIMAEEKISRKTIMTYIAFAITIFFVNQSFFMFFKDYNHYETLGVSRSLNIMELKKWGETRRAELYRQYQQNPRGVEAQIKNFQQIISILTHPARRLTYDSFGLSQTQYAWAFKFPNFILSTIIGSGSFFVICTFVSLMNKKKSDVKQAFKVQIFAMILLFIWQVDLIISTQSRLNNNSPDFIDFFYKAFPIFQRREMLKSIVIPCMSLVEIFVRFFMTSPAQQKLLTYGSLQKLQKITLPIRQSLGDIKNDENLQDRIKVSLQKFRSKTPLAAQIFELQRKNIQTILQTHRQQIIAKQKLSRIVNYFVLK